MTTYTTINDYIAQVVNPALGEYADDYDTEEIARDMTEWHDEKDAKETSSSTPPALSNATMPTSGRSPKSTKSRT